LKNKKNVKKKCQNPNLSILEYRASLYINYKLKKQNPPKHKFRKFRKLKSTTHITFSEFAYLANFRNGGFWPNFGQILEFLFATVGKVVANI